MENVIKALIDSLKKIYGLKYKLEDKDYWINRAKEEAGFIPKEGDWISIEIQTWKITVHVYHKDTDHQTKEARYWINGEWFDTPFPKKYPDL